MTPLEEKLEETMVMVFYLLDAEIARRELITAALVAVKEVSPDSALRMAGALVYKSKAHLDAARERHGTEILNEAFNEKT